MPSTIEKTFAQVNSEPRAFLQFLLFVIVITNSFIKYIYFFLIAQLL